MKKIVLASIFIAVGCNAAGASDIVGGIVVLDHYDCEVSDRIVVETRRGYTTAEVYRGYRYTSEGDIIYGELHSYGFTDIYDEDGDEVGRIYVDDYWVDDEDAINWCAGRD